MGIGDSGQATTTDLTRYFSSNNVAVNNPAGETKLNGSFGVYDLNGDLTSSTFDTGSVSNFHQLFWLPADQPPATGADSVRMQIATNNDGETWNFVGPDGSATSFYNQDSVRSFWYTVAAGRYLRFKTYRPSRHYWFSQCR